jgi:hypothetical protein
MILSILLSASVLAAGIDGQQSSTASNPAAEATPLHVLSRVTSQAMRREALAKDGQEKSAAIAELCDLHRVLLTDARYEQVDKLQDLRGQVYSRLRRVQSELKRESAASKPAASRPAGQGTPPPVRTPEQVSSDALADEAALAAADSLASSMYLMDATIGGPSALVAEGGRAVMDNGQALVDLIERTINPAFWDTSGGPGAVVYYQPLQCLVVRASGSMHERLGGLVGDLRAAGR